MVRKKKTRLWALEVVPADGCMWLWDKARFGGGGGGGGDPTLCCRCSPHTHAHSSSVTVEEKFLYTPCG